MPDLQPFRAFFVFIKRYNPIFPEILQSALIRVDPW
jgi:hypothetical protein